MQFAVVDVETTGLFPGGHDRIVELAIVRLSRQLATDRELSSLLNPKRDIGPTTIHGIRSRDVLQAPEFSEIAGAVVEALKGTVVVGHNVIFDLRFLEAEFSRMAVQITRPPYIDTMYLAVDAGSGSRSLEAACAHLDIDISQHHTALHDARATAELFTRCVGDWPSTDLETRIRNRCDPTRIRWPQLRAVREPVPRSACPGISAPTDSFLKSIAKRLPAGQKTDGDWQSYFALLDRALEDRRITPNEAEALADEALRLGMSRSALRTANKRYLRDVVRVAKQDHILSELEHRDIRDVARLLHLEDEVENLVERTGSATGASSTDVPRPAVALKGRSVCFTGALNAVIDGKRATRELATRTAIENGMTVKKSVTKDLDYLVVADPYSQSGKAKKAHRYGIRILAESVFWSATGVSTGA